MPAKMRKHPFPLDSNFRLQLIQYDPETLELAQPYAEGQVLLNPVVSQSWRGLIYPTPIPNRVWL